MRYVRGLDGIRGVAVLLVVLFHYGYFPLGWIGVQIFFTLSGYLITSILLEDRLRPFVSYVGQFYWRRSLRIFPVFFAFMLVAGASYALFGLPRTYGSDWAYLLCYAANFARMRASDIGVSFIHLWSLAVEEQFYLLWPLLVYLVPLSRFKYVVVAVLVLSPVIRAATFELIQTATHSTDYAGRLTYVLPFTQFDAFAAGAAIPLFNLHKLKHADRWMLGSLGLAAALGLGVLAINHLWRGGAFIASCGYAMYLVGNYQYVWGYSLINVVSVLGLICTLQEMKFSKVLALSPLLRVGKISYGVYLYHVPVFVALQWAMVRFGIHLLPLQRLGVFVVYVTAVLMLSEASFRWLESPFLARKDYWTKRARKAASSEPRIAALATDRTSSASTASRPFGKRA